VYSRLNHLTPDQQLGDDGGNLVFIASSRHAGEMGAQPRLVVEVPVLLREMRFKGTGERMFGIVR